MIIGSLARKAFLGTGLLDKEVVVRRPQNTGGHRLLGNRFDFGLFVADAGIQASHTAEQFTLHLELSEQ